MQCRENVWFQYRKRLVDSVQRERLVVSMWRESFGSVQREACLPRVERSQWPQCRQSFVVPVWREAFGFRLQREAFESNAEQDLWLQYRQRLSALVQREACVFSVERSMGLKCRVNFLASFSLEDNEAQHYKSQNRNTLTLGPHPHLRETKQAFFYK